MNSVYDKLRGGSTLRMRELRRYVTYWNTKQPQNTIGWRKARTFGISSIGSDAHGLSFSKDGNSAGLPLSIVSGFRDVGAASDIVRSLPDGYYTDEFQDGTYSGHVWQLPARSGEPQYIAGYAETDAGYVCLDCTAGRLNVYAEKEDAARAADGLAESNAETEREYQYRWRKATDADDAVTDACEQLRKKRDAYRNTLHAFLDARQARAQVAADALRAELRAIASVFHALSNTLRDLREDAEQYADVDR